MAFSLVLRCVHGTVSIYLLIILLENVEKQWVWMVLFLPPELSPPRSDVGHSGVVRTQLCFQRFTCTLLIPSRALVSRSVLELLSPAPTSFICKGGKNKDSTRLFLVWFFNTHFPIPASKVTTSFQTAPSWNATVVKQLQIETPCKQVTEIPWDAWGLGHVSEWL